jgi:nicotinamidase-related amidase
MEDSKSLKEIQLINPEKTALVVIDLQAGIANRELSPYTGKQVVENARKLANVFSEKGAFIALVRVSSVDGKDRLNPRTDLEINPVQPPKGWDIIVPELNDISGTHIITKRQWGAFYGTDLDLQLRRRGVDTIVLCGIATGIGVDTTAREAYQYGYNQIFAEDAMTGITKEEHDYVCNYIFPRIGKVRSTEDVISLLK